MSDKVSRSTVIGGMVAALRRNQEKKRIARGESPYLYGDGSYSYGGVVKNKKEEGKNITNATTNDDGNSNDDNLVIKTSTPYWDGVIDSDGNLNKDEEESGTIRFNKFTLHDDGGRKHLPLTDQSYPISADMNIVNMLKRDTDAVSVVNNTNDYEIVYNIASLIQNSGGLPDHPPTPSDSNAPYWNKLRAVMDMRDRYRAAPNAFAQYELSDVMQMPSRWENFTQHDVAEAVHDEYPGLHQSLFIEDLLGGKYGEAKFDHNIIPRRCQSQFLRGIVMLADLNTWTIGKVAPHSFAAKWYAGRARPEEIVWKIKQGEVNGVPDDIHTRICHDMSDYLNHPQDFTNYSEGCPRHPSWPAMHSAASNISFWLQIVMDLSEWQVLEAKKIDYAVAYARTIAGVHFEDDNIDGLNMGQEVIASVLPEYLVQKYDCPSAALVQRKCQSNRFDWNNYDPLEAIDSTTPVIPLLKAASTPRVATPPKSATSSTIVLPPQAVTTTRKVSSTTVLPPQAVTTKLATTSATRTTRAPAQTTKVNWGGDDDDDSESEV